MPCTDELWFAHLTYGAAGKASSTSPSVIDAYSRLVVGWQFPADVRTDLVLDALRSQPLAASARPARVHAADPS
jgi:transposase InsO family protein